MSSKPLLDEELHHFTRDEFRKMIDAGVFTGDERLELLHGRLVVVPPQGPPHSYTASILDDRLSQAYSKRALVREAKPLDCGIEEVPEPDLVVVRGKASDYVTRDPRGDESVLVIEVSRTTQKRDREKAAIYAACHVPVYWIIDIEARRAEVHEQPVGDRYALVRVVGEDEELELPDVRVRFVVRDLLP